MRESGGAPSIAEARDSARAATMNAVSQHPLVKAALEAFPGAKIIDVIEAETLGAADAADPETMDEE